MSIPDPLPESVDDIGNPNIQAKRSQGLRWLLLIGSAAIVGGIAFYVMNFRNVGPASPAQQKALEQRTLATASAAGPAPISPQAENTVLRGQMSDLQQELEIARQQNAQLATENAGLNQALANGRIADQAPPAWKGTNQAAGRPYEAPRGSSAAQVFRQAPVAPMPMLDSGKGSDEVPPAGGRTIKVVTFTPVAGPATKVENAADKASIYDSTQYVAPNSYVQARVLVGVDMQAGISATADPKPVLFRIDGLAVGVGANGRYQTSNLAGCLVNGAAFAELSSEKVYIKLQKISCPIDGNRYLVSRVDGYVTYMGKSGVRGRVVSREGNFANKALVAGTLQGLGQAMSLNNQRTLTSVGSTGVTTAPLSGSEIAQAAAGSGVGNASSMLADYYIKRAEQYQPVIEMPTGMTVELVFLDGFRFTDKGAAQ